MCPGQVPGRYQSLVMCSFSREDVVYLDVPQTA